MCVPRPHPDRRFPCTRARSHTFGPGRRPPCQPARNDLPPQESPRRRVRGRACAPHLDRLARRRADLRLQRVQRVRQRNSCMPAAPGTSCHCTRRHRRSPPRSGPPPRSAPAPLSVGRRGLPSASGAMSLGGISTSRATRMRRFSLTTRDPGHTVLPTFIRRPSGDPGRVMRGPHRISPAPAFYRVGSPIRAPVPGCHTDALHGYRL